MRVSVGGQQRVDIPDAELTVESKVDSCGRRQTSSASSLGRLDLGEQSQVYLISGTTISGDQC